MFPAFEYRGYRVHVGADIDRSEYEGLRWRGSFHFFPHDGTRSPCSGTISRAEESVSDATRKAARVARSFIDAHIASEAATHTRYTSAYVLDRH